MQIQKWLSGYNTIFFIIFLHEEEWVVVDVAEEFDPRLYAPVEIVALQKLMSEEKSTLESAHVTI